VSWFLGQSEGRAWFTRIACPLWPFRLLGQALHGHAVRPALKREVVTDPISTLRVVMNGARNFAAQNHPNAVIARREMERQERSRLRRLSEVRPSSAAGSRIARERPSSACRNSRHGSRPPSGQLSGHRAEEQFDSLRSRVPSSPAGSPSKAGVKGSRRSLSESGVRLKKEFLLSPQRRLEDAALHFQVSTAEQARALQEELQSWYFGNGANFNIEVEPCGQVGTSPAGTQWNASVEMSSRPPVNALEEAAAAVKAKVTGSSAFDPPPPMAGYSADRTPGRGASGGARGVAAATANRQSPLP